MLYQVLFKHIFLPVSVRIFCVSELAYANRTVKKIKAFCFIYFDFRLFYQLATANYKHIIPFICAFVNTFFKKISERSHAPKFIKSQNLYSHIIQSVFFTIFLIILISFFVLTEDVFLYSKRATGIPSSLCTQPIANPWL